VVDRRLNGGGLLRRKGWPDGKGEGQCNQTENPC